ncbi:Protein YLS9 [Fagus crenata]
MAEKQPQLNGAYYGPSVPPKSSQSYHRHGRGRGCGCCGCLLCFLLKFIISLVVIVGLAILIFWLIFRPNKVNFYVNEASLTQFNFTENNNLQYNLALNITVRNPNKKIGIYYDKIEARAYYEDQRFDTKLLTPFYQGHKTTSELNPVFQGQKVVLLGTDELSEFNTEKSAGVYNIDVKLYLRIRFKVGKLKTWKMKPKIECDLKVPFGSNGNSAGFEKTKCDIDF